MSTKTTNYELIKPELTDAADITQTNPNWDKLDQVIKEESDKKAPVSHASGEKIHGLGSSTAYGHLKLSNAINATQSLSDGVAATPYAVKLVNDKAEAAQTSATEAKSAASQALTDAKSYTDTKLQEIPTPDVSGQINTHNTSTTAHSDIRTAVNEAKSAADGKLPKTGGTLTGSLKVEISEQQNIVSINPTSKIAYMQYHDVANSVAANLAVSNTQLYYQTSNDLQTWTKYPILHTGNKNQIFTYGTSDLSAGTSSLETGMLYFVYE